MRRVLWPFILFVSVAGAQTAPPWVARSNQYARLLLDVDARYSPEDAAAEGLSEYDERIFVPSTGLPARIRADFRKVSTELEKQMATEKDPLVRQDLQILIQAADQRIRSSEAYEKYFLAYDNPGAFIFYGVKSLLDDQIAPSRRLAALVASGSIRERSPAPHR